MFTCLKCGRKLKTLHIRVYGDKNHYEPSGYHCETCRIYYDVKTNNASKAVYGVAKSKNNLGGLTAGENAFETEEPERMRSMHKPNAYRTQNACENGNAPIVDFEETAHERARAQRDSNPRPTASQAAILSKLNYGP